MKSALKILISSSNDRQKTKKKSLMCVTLVTHAWTKSTFFIRIKSWKTCSRVDSLDWKNLGKENILNRVTSKVKNGSIILMHNGTKDTAAVLPELIRQLKEKGYEFKPISEFIYKDNYVIDHAGMQKLN